MNSDPRPHWDDDLFGAVIDALGPNCQKDNIYPLIAAVEDWHLQRRTEIGGVAWLLASHATQGDKIQRIRDILDDPESDVCLCGRCAIWIDGRAIRAILND